MGSPIKVSITRVLMIAVAVAVVPACGGQRLSQAGAATGSPKPSTSSTSIPPDADQAALAISAERLKLLDDLRNAAAASPQRYGGVATWGDANIRLCDNGSGADAAKDTAVSALRATGAKVTIQACAHNLALLNKVLAEAASSTLFSSNGVTLRRWGIDYDRNAVEIGVDTITPGLADKVTALWGDAVYVMSATLECAGTGVVGPTGTVALDLGESMQTTYAVTIREGEELFIGANDCATYGVPSVAELPPQLTQVVAPSAKPFAVTYRGVHPGAADLSISCSGSFCRASKITVALTVVVR